MERDDAHVCQNVKNGLLLGCMSICFLLGFGLYSWLTQSYFPVRDVAPIVHRMERGDFVGGEHLILGTLMLPNGEIARMPDKKAMTDPNRIRIRCRGAEKIKQVILKVLDSAEDSTILRNTFLCIIAGTIGENILFDKPEEREILEKAVARYNNAVISDTSIERPWSVNVTLNGYYYIQMGGFIRR